MNKYTIEIFCLILFIGVFGCTKKSPTTNPVDNKTPQPQSTADGTPQQSAGEKKTEDQTTTNPSGSPQGENSLPTSLTVTLPEGRGEIVTQIDAGGNIVITKLPENEIGELLVITGICGLCGVTAPTFSSSGCSEIATRHQSLRGPPVSPFNPGFEQNVRNNASFTVKISLASDLDANQLKKLVTDQLDTKGINHPVLYIDPIILTNISIRHTVANDALSRTFGDVDAAIAALKTQITDGILSNGAGVFNNYPSYDVMCDLLSGKLTLTAAYQLKSKSPTNLIAGESKLNLKLGTSNN